MKSGLKKLIDKWPLFLVITISFFLLTTLSGAPSFYIDEYWIASIAARSFAEEGIVNTSFRNYSPEYINVQPLYILMLGGIVKLLGNSLFVTRLLSALSIIGCAFILAKLSWKRPVNYGSFFLSIALILVTPIVWRTAHICRPEPIVLLAILLTLYINTEVNGHRFFFDLMAGITLALPIYIYITGVLVLPMVGYLFVQECVKNRSNKMILMTGGTRALGLIIGIALFFIWVGTPMQIWSYLSEGEISKVNVSNTGFLSRAASYLKYYANYQVENLYLYLPAWIIIFYSFYTKNFKGSQTMFLVFYVVAVIFLTVLSRKTVNYLIYSEIFFVLLITSSLTNLKPLVRGISVVYMISLGVLFSFFYSMYFSGFDPKVIGAQLEKSIDSKDAVVIARMPYKYFFFKNDKYLGLEEFEYLTRTNRGVSASDYLQSNLVEWVILDDASSEKAEIRPIVEYVQNNFKLVQEITDAYMGHRIYEDIPYEWDFSRITKRMKTRPKSTIKIYRRY